MITNHYKIYSSLIETVCCFVGRLLVTRFHNACTYCMPFHIKDKMTYRHMYPLLATGITSHTTLGGPPTLPQT